MKVLGFDPGGAEGFGCAVFDSSSGGLVTAALSSVDDVFDWTKTRLGEEVPIAVGVDSILHWQTTKSGWRGADEYLRTNYPKVSTSVQPSNSCVGSMAVQGLTLVMRLKEEWPEILVTETHPKVLWNHITKSRYPKWNLEAKAQFTSLLDNLGFKNIEIDNDHEFDAAISCWAALNTASQNWSLDLIDVSAKNQKYKNLFPAGNVHYGWPEVEL